MPAVTITIRIGKTVTIKKISILLYTSIMHAKIALIVIIIIVQVNLLTSKIIFQD